MPHVFPFTAFIRLHAHFFSSYTRFFRVSRLLILLVIGLSSLSWGQCFKLTSSSTNAKGYPTSIGVGDFNGDSRQDVVMTTSRKDSITVFLTDENGLLNTRTSFYAGPSLDSLAVSDINLDGKPDVVVRSYRGSSYRESVTILLGNGKGGFAAPINLDVDQGLVTVTVSDFNADGKPDIAGCYAGDKFDVLSTDGNARSVSLTRYATGRNTELKGIRAGDFNADGHPDLVLLGDFHGKYLVSLALNNGKGGFDPATHFGEGTLPPLESLDIGDFNADGKPDLVVAGNGAFVLINNGNGGFTINKLTSLGTGPHYVVVGDLNADGKPDLAFPGYILMGIGNGLFGDPISTGFTDEATGLATGDFDYNGRLDLAISTSDKISVFLNCILPLRTAPKPTPNDSQTATVGVPVSYTANSFTDAETPDSLKYSASISPANGLSFDPATRIISGTPSTTGISTVTVTATDPVGLTASTSFTVAVKAPIILGMAESEADELTVSPNPATDLVRVVITNRYRGSVMLSLVDGTGQTIRTYTSAKTGVGWLHTLSLQGLPVGVYYLTVQQGQGQVVRKVLKL